MEIINHCTCCGNIIQGTVYRNRKTNKSLCHKCYLTNPKIKSSKKIRLNSLR